MEKREQAKALVEAALKTLAAKKFACMVDGDELGLRQIVKLLGGHLAIVNKGNQFCYVSKENLTKKQWRELMKEDGVEVNTESEIKVYG
jgi:hypothetical protein